MQADQHPIMSCTPVSVSMSSDLFSILQDGYAVSYKDGAGEYEVEFEATAGTAQKRLTSGKLAYIGTGEPRIETLFPGITQY